MNNVNGFKYLSALLVLVVGVYFLSSVMMPFFLGAVLAYLGDPIVNKLKHYGIPRVIGVTFVFILASMLVLMLLFWLMPLFAEQLLLLGQRVVLLFNWLQTDILPWVNAKFGVADNLEISHVREQVVQHLSSAGGAARTVLATASQSTKAIVSFVTGLFLVPVVAFYLMRDWPRIVENLSRVVKQTWGAELVAMVRDCDEVISAFFKGQLLVMIGLGVIYSLGLWMVGIKVALLIGVLSGFMAIVPYLGFIVGIVAASFAAFSEYQSVSYVLMVWGVYGVGQCIESMVLTPLFVGDKIGLHPVVVIFAVLAGGSLFGFMGVLLALPVAASLKVFLMHSLNLKTSRA